jgi:hypothetical protein
MEGKDLDCARAARARSALVRAGAGAFQMTRPAPNTDRCVPDLCGLAPPPQLELSWCFTPEGAASEEGAEATTDVTSPEHDSVRS